MRRALPMIALVLLAEACGQSRPTPEVDSVAPDVVTTLTSTVVTIDGRNFFADAEAGLDSGGSEMRVFRVLVGDSELAASSITWVDTSTLLVVIPKNFSAGVHDL